MTSLNRILDGAQNHGQTTINRVDYLDGWRGIAIGLVLLAHFLRDWQYGFAFGRMGVDVFFVLSGLLMSNILFVKRTPLTTFYKRRFSRILPAFLFFSLAIYTMVFFKNPAHPELDNILYTLSFLRTYLPADAVHMWKTGLPIGHIWSLNIEEHCYILLSLITLIGLLRGREYLLILILGIACILLRWLYLAKPEYASNNFDLRTEINASHLLISAGYFLLIRNIKINIPSWLPLLSFIGAFFCYTPYVHEYARWALSPFFLAFAANHLAETPAFFKKALSFAPLRLLGILSFSVYLWQQPFFYYFQKVNTSVPLTISAPLGISLSIVFGCLSFYMIENPIRRYLNNHW